MAFQVPCSPQTPDAKLWCYRFAGPATPILATRCQPSPSQVAVARRRPELRLSQTESHLGLKCVKKLIKSNHLLAQPVQMTRSFKETLP